MQFSNYKAVTFHTKLTTGKNLFYTGAISSNIKTFLEMLYPIFARPNLLFFVCNLENFCNGILWNGYKSS